MTDIEIRSGSTIAKILPDRGFNCYSFVVDGFDYLYQTDDLFPDGKPTRSGIPILFPWPNRIAGSRFTWDGREYQVPVTEEATGASLHGFACRTAWQVLDQQEDRVTGEWILSRDAADKAEMWPADAGLRVTYRVEPTVLDVTTEVFCNDDADLPFGLGFHPYLRVPGPFDQWLLQCDASQMWPLTNMTPSGAAEPVPGDLDFRKARRLGDQHLDNAYTGLPETGELSRRAGLLSMASALAVSSDPGFGDYVLYTNPDRDAVAIEPYTCATDAVNLQAQGIAAGWQVLPAGQTASFRWRIDVE